MNAVVPEISLLAIVPPGYNQHEAVMRKLIHEYAIEWFHKHQRLVAIQLQIGHPVGWLFDGLDNGPRSGPAFLEMSAPPLTADDTLAILHALYPDPLDSWRGEALAGRPLAVVKHNLLFSISLEDDGLEIWILRRHINPPAPTPDAPPSPDAT